MNSVISQIPRQKSRRVDPVILKFALIGVVCYAPMAASSYASAFLQNANYSATNIGIVMCLMNVCAIVSPPFWGALSDKLRSLRKVLFICLAGGSVLYALTPYTSVLAFGTLGLVFLSLPAANFFRAPVGALTDSWTICASKKYPKLVYGRVRLWGSISYATAVFIIGVFNNLFSSFTYTFILYAVMNIPLCVICLLPQEDYAPAKPPGSRISLRDMQFSRLFKNYPFVTYLFLTTILHISFLSFMSFILYLFIDITGNRDLLGTSFCIKALGEIPLLFLSHHLLKRFGMTKSIITIGVLFASIQFVFMLCRSSSFMLLLMFIYGMGFGFFSAVNVHYVYKITPPELNATAMTLVGALGAISGAICNLFGGVLVDAIGIRGFFLITGIIQAAGTLIFILTIPFGKHLSKIKGPDFLYRL